MYTVKNILQGRYKDPYYDTIPSPLSQSTLDALIGRAEKEARNFERFKLEPAMSDRDLPESRLVGLWNVGSKLWKRVFYLDQIKSDG